MTFVITELSELKIQKLLRFTRTKRKHRWRKARLTDTAHHGALPTIVSHGDVRQIQWEMISLKTQ